MTLPVAGHKRSFPWLPEQRGVLHSYNPCHPCMKSCVYLGHPTSYHSLTSFSSCIPPCPSAPIPPSPSFSILLSQVIGSLQHFSILLLSFIAGAWLEGTCNLAMTMTMKAFKFFVSSTQPPTSFPVRQQHLAPSTSQKVLIDH